MFRFTVQGRIGSINEYRSNTLSISVAADRLVEGRDGQYTATEWMRCVSFDAELNKQMLVELEKGQLVTFEGRLVPRVRDKSADKKTYETALEITSFQRGAKPKANGRAKSAPAETANASV
ncbi:single-stranded DNA-binding protein [Terricaulis silvestris]|uniref:Single-strand binding protein family protein n=1 Tax=Terricaulis silvestris TaxID=2686094 RepID=A0A6I6MII1_9CAUL|nr:single-stranded DNA-binding protein [Terricaulis silvestris]QGZ94905.1 Single-strand binding protein family protein [Terricaulis silvestris]